MQDGLEHPWDIAFAPDERMLVTERAGRVLVFESAAAEAPLLHTATIPDVRAELESGLMGIAIDGTTVYVCASRDPGGDSGEPWRVQLLRSTLADDGSLAPFEVVPIGEAMGGPATRAAPSRSPMASSGSRSATRPPAGKNRVQDLGSLNGKILRLALDGSIPDDKPVRHRRLQPRPSQSEGHRRVASTGLILAAEHGTDVNDEINVIVTGGNDGYPCFTGVPIPGLSLTAAARLPITSRRPGRPARRRSRRRARRSPSARAGPAGRATDREHAQGGGPPCVQCVGDW